MWGHLQATVRYHCNNCPFSPAACLSVFSSGALPLNITLSHGVNTDYAFTEMMTLHLQADATIADGLTTAGRAFAQLVKLLLENEGTDKLRWGSIMEKNDVAMVIVGAYFVLYHTFIIPDALLTSANE
jgi:hypothetical protein